MTWLGEFYDFIMTLVNKIKVSKKPALTIFVQFTKQPFMRNPFLFIAALMISFNALAGGNLHNHYDPLIKRFMDDSKRPLDKQYQEKLRQQTSWQSFINRNGDWWVQFNETNARPHRAFGTPIPIGISGNAASAGLYFLRNYTGGYLPSNIDLEFVSAPESRKYIQPNFIQKYNGVEVLWSRATVKLTKDFKAVMFGLDVYDDISLSITPTLSPAQAISFATAGINNPIQSATAGTALKILPIPGFRNNVYHLVYEVTVRTGAEDHPVEYYTLVDANNGSVLYRKNNIESISGSSNTNINVTGTVYPTHPYNSSAVVNLPHLQLSIGGNNFFADSLGFFNLPNTSPFSGTFSLAGPYARVFTGANGNTLQSFTSTVNPGNNSVDFDPNSTIRHLSAYYHTNVVHDFMKTQLPTFTGLDFPISVKVDRTDGTCNAFYDGGLNFYTTAGGCYALSMVADVVYHEYGHGITNVYWSNNGLSFSNGGMGEGYSDIWAICITNNPVLGIGFSNTDPTTYVRNYDFSNNVSRKVYPDDIVGQVHSDGEIIAGAWWSTRLLMGSLSTMASIFGESHAGLANGPDGAEGQVYTDILIDALFADDNDANLANGTPNSAAISQGFAQHGITLLSNASLNHTPVNSAAANTGITLNAALTNVQFAWAFTGLTGAYKINNTGAWTPFSMTNTGGNNYSATIPAQPKGTLISYYLGVEDVNGTLSNVKPSEANASNPNIPYFIMVGFDKIFTDDFDNSAGSWVDGLPSDGATTGEWEQSFLEQTTIGGGVVQPDYQVTPGGQFCYVTQGIAGNSPGDYDVDNGATTITSPVYDLTGYLNPAFEYFRWYSNDQGATPGTDYWQVYISNDGVNYIPVENTNVADHSWRRFVFRVNDYFTPGSTFTVRFVAEDANAGSLIEALMDDFSLYDEAAATAVQETSGITGISAWPIPAGQHLQVRCILKTGGDFDLTVTNAIGQIVDSRRVSLLPGSNDFQLATADYAEGLYHLRLVNKDSDKTVKFSVRH